MNEVISAQVILKKDSASQKLPDELITAANIENFRVGPALFQKAMAYFAAQRFKPEAPATNSFSITAGKTHFEKFFGVKIICTPETGYMVYPEKNYLLPANNLTPEIQEIIECITFSEPPQLFDDAFGF